MQKGTAVAAYLRAAIIRGELIGGTRIRQLDTARRLQTSQGPVREALRILEAEGLVRRPPNGSTYVTDLDAAEAREAAHIRGTVEARAAHLLVASWSQDSERSLTKALEDLRVEVRAADSYMISEAHLTFHRTLCILSGSSVLLRVWESLAANVRQFNPTKGRVPPVTVLDARWSRNTRQYWRH